MASVLHHSIEMLSREKAIEAAVVSSPRLKTPLRSSTRKSTRPPKTCAPSSTRDRRASRLRLQDRRRAPRADRRRDQPLTLEQARELAPKSRSAANSRSTRTPTPSGRHRAQMASRSFFQKVREASATTVFQEYGTASAKSSPPPSSARAHGRHLRPPAKPKARMPSPSSHASSSSP